MAARVLESWLVAINTLRNCCAHHARLWNREFGTKPKIPRDARWREPVQVRNDRVFGLLTIMSFLLRTTASDTGWRGRLLELLEPLPEDDLRRMGFPEGWEACPMRAPWRPRRMTRAKRGSRPLRRPDRRRLGRGQASTV